MSSCISFGSPHGSHFSDRSSVSHYALNRRGDRRGLDGGNDLQDPRNIRSGYRIVHTSGNNLKCGYYALGIGILGMSQERRNSIYDIIGVDQNSTVRTAAPPYSQTQLNAFQMEVGDALYEYARQNRESILRNLDLDPNVLNIAHFETMGDTYIQADYLVAIGISLGIKTILYNHDHNEGDVYIRNLSSHYEGMLPENVLMSDPLNCLSPSASISKGNDKSGFYLGSGTISLRDSFRHVLVKGRTGMGATSRIFIPGILALNDENALVTDIDGTIYKATAERMQQKGYNVVVLDLMNPSQSSTFNPLAGLKVLDERIDEILDAVFSHMKTEGDNAVFLENAKSLSRFMVNKLIYDHKHNDGEVPTLPLFKRELNRFTFQDLKENYEELHEKVTSGSASKDLTDLYDQVCSVANISDDLFNSAKVFIGPAIAVLGKDVPSQITSGEDTVFDTLSNQDEKTIIYLRVSGNDVTNYKVIMGLFFQHFFRFMKQGNPSPDRRPTLCYLDEFGNYNISGFATIITTIRKFNVGIMVGLQSDQQVLENYKGDGKTILENFNTEVCLEHDIKQLLINRSLKLKSKIPEFYTDPTTGMVNISENSSYSYDQLTYLLPSEAILIQNSEAEIIEVPVFKSEISDLKSKSVNDLTPPTMDKDVAVPTSTFMQRSGYNALATGILGLGDADRDHCLEKLKIKELVSPLLATSYTHDHLQMLQEMIGIFIYEFALSNEADIKIKVIQQDSKGIDSEKLAALQKMNIFEELDPLFLIKLGEMIGLKVVVPGSAKMHKDDLTYPVVNINQVGKNYEGRLTESKLKSQSLQSKLNLTDLNETKFCEELLAKDHLTFNALVMVYKNLVFNRVDASKMSMLIGETQTGKTTIFQMLMGLYEANNEFSDAIGDGMESKTVLPKVFKYGNKLFMDTPGLEDTRNCLILTSLVHYQIIELLKSGKLSQLILTFNPKDFDSESSANNSLKKFVTFFQSICNIRALDGGFYENEMETIINELRAKNYALLPLQNEKSMAALGKQHWETFFERLEKRIEKMPTLPFKAIVKGIKHATESSIISEIDKQIAQYKAKCIGRMVSGYDDKGLRQDVSRDFLINYLIFLMIIRRTITVNNCPDSEEQLRAEILDHENDFDYTSIFLEEDQITDEHGVLKRFSDQIDEVLNEKEQWINSYFNCIENIRNKMKEIDSLVVSIKVDEANLKSENFSSQNNPKVKLAESNIKAMEIELQKCKEGLQFNQGELKGYLVDSVVDDKGYPVKKCASGIFWKYADFNHGAQDQNKLLLETPYRTKYKSTWTTAQFDWFFNETRTNFDVIAHKYVPKKERYAEYISNLRKNISTLETQIKTLKTKMETEQQKLEAIKKTSREKLAEAIVANKVELEKLKTAMSNVVRENLQVIKEVDNSWMDLIASHQFFRDENLVFLRKVLGQAPMVNAYLRNVEKLIQVKSRMQLVALSKGEK